MSHQYSKALLTAALSLSALAVQAQDAVPKAIIAIVGDVDRFSIGQNDYCGEKNEVASPSGKKFRIPANKESFFTIQSKVRMHNISVTCEGDYSFTPAEDKLHIIRYSMLANSCKLEMFISEPGGDPIPWPVKREERRSCIFK